MFKTDQDTIETVNDNFEGDLKAIDPDFDMSKYKELMDGLEDK